MQAAKKKKSAKGQAKKQPLRKAQKPKKQLDEILVEKEGQVVKQETQVIAPVELGKAESAQESKSEDSQPENSRKEKIILNGIFAEERVLLESCDTARDFYNQSCYGKILEDGKLQLSLCEGLYLMERNKIRVFDKRNKELDFETFIARARKVEPNFWIRYSVFKNIRNRGYIIKTALKFGADFRVYDRGVKPGDDHARWIIYPVHEGSTITWYEFAAKNRVAHSTKKRLMIGIVDDEGDVTYYEIRWIRP